MNYLEKIAHQIKSRVPDDALPDGHVHELFLIYAVLVLAKGAETTAADVHNAWSAWMTHHDASHKSLVPFSSLAASTKKEDSPYLRAIWDTAYDLDD